MTQQTPAGLCGPSNTRCSSRLGILTILLISLVARGWPQTSPLTSSPAIRSLVTQISSGRATAVEEFWSTVAKQHSPVVEADPADANYSLVTFVWRGDAHTKNVVVISPLALIDFENAVMQPVPGSDVWFKTYRARNDARMSYRFAINDTLVPFDRERNLFARMKTWQIDPLNPRKFEVGEGIKASVLELQAAPSDQWTRQSETIAKGTMTRSEFRSDMLHNERVAMIYRPANYDPGKVYPLLVVLDGDSYTSLIPLPTILDNLIAAKAIPPVIALLLENASPEAREHEMNCNKSWSDSLVEEVIPWLRMRQNLRFTDGSITIMGDSLAGLAAACAVHDYPHVFGKVISQSGSYFRAPQGEEPEWLARQLAIQPSIPVQFYLEIGLLETSAIPSRDPSMLTSNRHLRDVLLAKGNQVRYVEHFSGHEHLSWRATLADALIYMLNVN